MTRQLACEVLCTPENAYVRAASNPRRRKTSRVFLPSGEIRQRSGSRECLARGRRIDRRFHGKQAACKGPRSDERYNRFGAERRAAHLLLGRECAPPLRRAI